MNIGVALSLNSARIVLVSAGLLLAASAPALAERPPVLRCAFIPKDGQPQAVCDIGPAADLARVARVSWRKEGRTGTVDARYQPFLPGGKMAALMLVDRGDKARAKAVTSLAQDTMRLIDSTRAIGAGVRVGLALVGERLEPVAPLGATRDDLARAIAATRADGAIGDSAREVLTALGLLGSAADERRILVVASDGKAEDAAYGAQDVIDAARKARVTVIALVYRDGTEPGGLIGLRRLADETGGLVVEASATTGRIDDTGLARFAQFIRSGGTASFALDAVEPRGRYVVSAEMEGGGRLSGTFSADLDPSAPAVGTTTVASSAAPQRPAPDAPGLAESSGLDRVIAFAGTLFGANFVWLQWIGGGLAGLLLFGWIVRRWRRRGIRAYIQMEDEIGTRIAVRSAGVRIGRHSDNDIRFPNSSVHRYHAVLSRDAESGRYVITDVSRNQQRSNGVVVNGEIVTRAELSHGDLVELGEARFRFLYPGESLS